MKVSSLLSVDGIRSRLQSAWSYNPEDKAYIIFLFGFAVVMLGFYYLTTEATDPRTVIVPQLTIYATLLLIVAAIFNTFFNIGEMITPKTQDEDEDGLFDTEASVQYNLTFTTLMRKTGAMVIYILGVFYVGFYTVTVLFSFIYIYLNTDVREGKRLLYTIGVTVAIFVLLYVVFTIGLSVTAIDRLGFLP